MLQRLTGSFDIQRVLNVNRVMFDASPSGWAAPAVTHTTGQIAVKHVVGAPTSAQGWTLVGWSISYVGVVQSTIEGSKPWARYGDLWGGVLVDSPLQSSSPAQAVPGTPIGVLPADLSTFAKLYSGADDPSFPMVDSVNGEYPAYTRGAEQILPQPIHVEAGGDVEMALILTPSLMQVQSGGALPLIIIPRASYTILYE